MDSDGIDMTEFSDEILLNILRFVPSTDLILNVRSACKKFGTLCLDKSLTNSIVVSRDYQASDEKVKQMLKVIANEICILNLSSCYWLSGSTIDQVTKCKNILKLDLSGCRLTSLRLSKMLSALCNLRALAMDVMPGFDASQFSSECRATLGQIVELKQTLFTSSYGVVPACTSLERLLLYFEIRDRGQGGMIISGQLMVGESNVPNYQNLQLFYARLAPGYVNQEVMRLYLAVLSVRTPENLRAFLVSVPGRFAECGATKNILENMAKKVSLQALQLPKSWLNGSTLLPHIKFQDPFYFNFSRCTLSGNQLLQIILNNGNDLRTLVCLNLSGCIHSLLPDSSLREADDNIDSSILETVVASCPNLKHLNLSAAHHHSSEGSGSHLCAVLARLKYLRSLALPVCAIAEPTKDTGSSPNQTWAYAASSTGPRGFGKKIRIGVQTYSRMLSEQTKGLDSAFRTLMESIPFLEELELIGSSFLSAMPRNEPAIRNSLPPCARAQLVGEEEVAAIGRLTFLRSLTLAQLPGILTGSSLVTVGVKCKYLRVLSLANLGMMGKVNYMPSLCELLKHCKYLKDLRLEQPYFSANALFFQALSYCTALERLCIISRSGTFQPEAVMSFMASCQHVLMCHMFTGETLATCNSLQQSILRSFQMSRPALNVVIFPLLHESLAYVIGDVPMVHLDEVTLFKSRVAEEPPGLWHLA
ncbi:F-box/LRR-repeat protein 18 [Latimeria chalumnae]|uniref:F-box and leucine rich repeat protein 18 n=1 Tax=Latimeria chalumnae TaxID=7897 RepID=H3BC33_LATCH|nr:PREDICTED: F-box/LRR-repeat protein 18 [Latimeria chalumnae]|eukprot:XP_005992383.1 PREDICTED: F-box/LRR-repeat protein 18 [Latimeria chalumnae]